MRNKLLALLGSVALGATLAVIGVSSAAAEHGHGFNCTPGNPGHAEAVHTSHGKDDQGNGDNCPAASTPTTHATTTTKAVTPTTKAVTPTTKAAAKAVTVAPSAAPRPVSVAPRTTG